MRLIWKFSSPLPGHLTDISLTVLVFLQCQKICSFSQQFVSIGSLCLQSGLFSQLCWISLMFRVFFICRLILCTENRPFLFILQKKLCIWRLVWHYSLPPSHFFFRLYNSSCISLYFKIIYYPWSLLHLHLLFTFLKQWPNAGTCIKWGPTNTEQKIILCTIFCLFFLS